MYVYDCKIFKVASSFSKEEADFISSFMLVYRENVGVGERVFEMVDVNQLPHGQWLLKVKESGLLRVHGFMRDNMKRVKHREDKVVLD